AFPRAERHDAAGCVACNASHLLSPPQSVNVNAADKQKTGHAKRALEAHRVHAHRTNAGRFYSRRENSSRIAAGRRSPSTRRAQHREEALAVALELRLADAGNPEQLVQGTG